MNSTTFRANSPRIVHQTIEGETILIDFENGAYFSTAGAGAFIWERLCAGDTEHAILDAVASRFAGDRDHLDKEVRFFLGQLVSESLVLPLEAGSTSAMAGGQSIPPPEASTTFRPLEPAAPRSREPFEPPSLDKYTDMQDLLLLDPIHDVEDEGWPVRK